MEEFVIRFKAKIPDGLKGYTEGVHRFGSMRSETRNENGGFDLLHNIKFSYDFGSGEIVADARAADMEEAEKEIVGFLKRGNYI